MRRHCGLTEGDSKRNSIQTVELSQRLQTAVQTVSIPPTPNNCDPIGSFFGGKQIMRTRWIAGAAPNKSG